MHDLASKKLVNLLVDGITVHPSAISRKIKKDKSKFFKNSLIFFDIFTLFLFKIKFLNKK